MSTDNEEDVPDSEACPSDEEHDGPNANDEDMSPSQYKKSSFQAMTAVPVVNIRC